MSENTRNVAEAKFSLVICGENLPMDEISATMGVASTRQVVKGEILNRLPEIVAHEDAWFHTLQLSNPGGRDEVLMGMLNNIVAHKEYLQQLAQKGRVIMRVHLRSDRATQAWRWTPETLEILAETGFPLDVTCVSWGDIGI